MGFFDSHRFILNFLGGLFPAKTLHGSGSDDFLVPLLLELRGWIHANELQIHASQVTAFTSRYSRTWWIFIRQFPSCEAWDLPKGWQISNECFHTLDRRKSERFFHENRRLPGKRSYPRDFFYPCPIVTFSPSITALIFI